METLAVAVAEGYSIATICHVSGTCQRVAMVRLGWILEMEKGRSRVNFNDNYMTGEVLHV